MNRTMNMTKRAFSLSAVTEVLVSDELRTELLRKSIHFSIALVPFLASYDRIAAFWILAAGVVFYTYAESVRFAGREIPLVSLITRAAARKRDAGRFVAGPVTLGLGAMIALLLYPAPAATIAIYALAFGDGLASLVGKFFGTVKIPHTGGKTVEGFLACFAAVFVSAYAVSRNALSSLVIAVVAAIVEALPMKDMDNLVIPALIGLLATFIV